MSYEMKWGIYLYWTNLLRPSAGTVTCMHATRAIGTEILRWFLASNSLAISSLIAIKKTLVWPSGWESRGTGGGAYSPICPGARGWLLPALVTSVLLVHIHGNGWVPNIFYQFICSQHQFISKLGTSVEYGGWGAGEIKSLPVYFSLARRWNKA